MEEKFIFNYQKKRLEPISKNCCYCNTNETIDIDTNFFITLYKVNKRSNYFIYREVNYNKIDIGLPRCLSCKNIHKKARSNSITFYLALLILMVFISSMTADHDSKNFSIFTIYILLFSFLVFLIGDFTFKYFFPLRYFDTIQARKKGILSDINGAKQDETVKDFLKNGWSINSPFA